jgi:hypothetical protein
VRDVCGDHHATSGNLIAHLHGRQVWLALCNTFHLRGNDTKAGTLKLRDWRKSLRVHNAHPFTACGDKLNNTVRTVMMAA